MAKTINRGGKAARHLRSTFFFLGSHHVRREAWSSLPRRTTELDACYDWVVHRITPFFSEACTVVNISPSLLPPPVLLDPHSRFDQPTS